MRQAGICAAACLYALDHNVDRLAEDHRNAKALARGLRQMPGVAVEEPETNLVFFDPAGRRCAGARADPAAALAGVHLSLLGGRVRACTHLDVTEAMIEETLGLIRVELAEGWHGCWHHAAHKLCHAYDAVSKGGIS